MMRKTHPNLYLGIVGFGIFGILMGLTVFDNPYLPLGIPKELYAGVYFLLGILKLFGVNTKYLAVARVGMAGCVFVSLAFALGFMVMYFQTNAQGLLQLSFCHLMVGFIQFAPLREPAFNPLTAKKESEND